MCHGSTAVKAKAMPINRNVEVRESSKCKDGGGFRPHSHAHSSWVESELP